jgi:RimJ/RimL family protein N-acetyltransferase
MPTQMNTDSSDLDKLFAALSSITSIHSVDDVLAIFGLRDLPTGHKYGLLAGCITFALTILTVFILLIKGGSFDRLMEQASSGEPTIPSVTEARVGRALIMERLLESREALMKNYSGSKPEGVKDESSDSTILTKVLINVAPQITKAHAIMISHGAPKDDESKKKLEEDLNDCLPAGYAVNYVDAYRVCQDKPGGVYIYIAFKPLLCLIFMTIHNIFSLIIGPTLPGLPEARFEAYARAYAGCGTLSSTSYRRSYGRMYEAMSCQTHGTEKKYREHWLARPFDIVGRTVRLEPLDKSRHLEEMFQITNGDAYQENKAYDAKDVWCFRESGPFNSADEMCESFLFQRAKNEASFAIIESLTDRLVGIVTLLEDDPKNLSITIEPPIVKPANEGTVEQIEACFLLMDRLFAMGYRRIQYCIDSMDSTSKKLAGRLGFTQEGVLPKHRIVKDANRDSIVYGMLNSDWDKGARSFLFKKLHGAKAQQLDAARNAQESEVEEQQNLLKQRQAAELLMATALKISE